MAVPSEVTVAVGNKVSAALWNDDVKSAVDFLANPPHAFVYQTTGVSVGSGTATEILMTFDTESEDTDTMHSTSTLTSRMVCTTGGLYSVTFQVAFPANATGVRYAVLRKNAAGVSGGGTAIAFARQQSASATGASYVGATLDVRLTPGDYLELFGLQNSGGALTSVTGGTGTIMQARWVSS